MEPLQECDSVDSTTEDSYPYCAVSVLNSTMYAIRVAKEGQLIWQRTEQLQRIHEARWLGRRGITFLGLLLQQKDEWGNRRNAMSETA
jgi:hypothetical protein